VGDDRGPGSFIGSFIGGERGAGAGDGRTAPLGSPQPEDTPTGRLSSSSRCLISSRAVVLALFNSGMVLERNPSTRMLSVALTLPFCFME